MASEQTDVMGCDFCSNGTDLCDCTDVDVSLGDGDWSCSDLICECHRHEHKCEFCGTIYDCKSFLVDDEAPPGEPYGECGKCGFDRREAQRHADRLAQMKKFN